VKIKIAEELDRVPGFLYGQTIRRIADSYHPYQPVVIKGVQLSAGERAHTDRWEIIKQSIEAFGAKTLVDLGCAEGFFVEQAAAQCGCFALGIEGDVRRLSLAQASATLNRVKGSGFIYAEMTPEFVEKLPVFDAMLFMSVLHHIMYERGVDYAREYMQRLRSKVAKFMIFDTGQSNETENQWAKLLPDMGSTPHDWVSDFLKSAGFSKVEKLSDTDAYQGVTKRALFRLIP
jgi:cyclopropane fatty-acyl-phospholipid synthase-like methyltransferase